jgi:hypothetical protein
MSQLLLDTETLSFRIGLSGTYWNKKPEFSVLINDVELASGSINGPSGQIQYVEFTYEFKENSNNKLQIRLNNKADSDVIQNDDCTEILKDMLLNVESIEVDEINLSQLVWSQSKFIPDDTSRPTLKKCVNLGWNGTYVLEFTSSFYLWLLENM